MLRWIPFFITIILTITAVGQNASATDFEWDEIQSEEAPELDDYFSDALPWNRTVYATGSSTSEYSAKYQLETNLRWEIDREKRRCEWDKGRFSYYQWTPTCNKTGHTYTCRNSATCQCKVNSNGNDLAEDEPTTELRVSPVFSDRQDCRALAMNSGGLCKGPDCRAVFYHTLSWCRSIDCRAMVRGLQSQCETRDCKAVVLNIVGLCESYDCRAVMYGNPGLCH